MKKTKLISGLLALAMLAGFCAGCTTGSKKNEQVTLKYVMPGPGLQENAKEVWAAFNEKLHEKMPNLTVEFEIIPLSEYKQKVMLMLASREKVDIINNYGLDFATEVGNRTFAPMNDLIEQYGKDVVDTLPEWLWDYQKVDGEIYGIPSYQMMGQTRGVVFVKEVADKYVDYAAVEQALAKSETFNQELYDILTKYCEDVKADGLNFKTADILNLKGWETVTGSYGYVWSDKPVFKNYTVCEEQELRYKIASEWYKKGYIREDVASATDAASYKGKADGYLFWDDIHTPYQEATLSEKYGTEIKIIPYDVNPPIGFKALAGGTSIASASQYKEEAMQFLNLIQTDKELYNFLVWGREGVEYTKTGDDRIETPYGSQGTANDGYGLYKWIVGNTSLAYDTQADLEGYKQWAFEEVNNSPKISKLIGFQPDTADIGDIITQTNAIRGQYYNILNQGVMGDEWQSYYQEYKDKLAIAGDEKVITELQRQVDEFLANK